jgi:hypothetical protein
LRTKFCICRSASGAFKPGFIAYSVITVAASVTVAYAYDRTNAEKYRQKFMKVLQANISKVNVKTIKDGDAISSQKGERKLFEHLLLSV